MLREVLASEIWLSKPGSAERGGGWKSLADILNGIERLKFEVSSRSVREHFQALYDRRRAQNREEERASGIAPDELIEADTILDELISLFETAANDFRAIDRDKVEKVAAESAKAKEMRQQSLETLGETRKRMSGEEAVGYGKKARNTGKDTISWLRERMVVETEFRKREIELKEQELAENIKARELREQRVEGKNGESGADIVKLATSVEQMKQQINSLKENVLQMMQHLKHQNDLIIGMLSQLNSKQ